MAKKKKVKKKRRGSRRGPKTITTVLDRSRYGDMIEVRRFHDMRPGKRGRLVHPSDVRKIALRYEPQEEIMHYRVYPSGKKIGAPVYRRFLGTVTKKTFPTALEYYGGNIFEAIRDTNIMTEVHEAKRATLHVRGLNPNGQLVRFQSTIKLGRNNQHKQLVVTMRALMAKHGYRTQYNLNLVQYSRHGSRYKSARLKELDQVTFTITLFK